MVRFDEGPALNWGPLEVAELSEAEVAMYAEGLRGFREEWKRLNSGEPESE